MNRGIRWFFATILLFIAANAGLEYHSLPHMKCDIVSGIIIFVTSFAVGLLAYKENEYD